MNTKDLIIKSELSAKDKIMDIIISDALKHMQNNRLRDFASDLKTIINNQFKNYTHGHLESWLNIINKIYSNNYNQEELIVLLKKFSPWRKGPLNFNGIIIDTEWRSDWKWERIKPYIDNLEGKYVLDVGCGNGYHTWLMHKAGARQVVGIDPYQLNMMQFLVAKYFNGLDLPVNFIPIGIESMPLNKPLFETIFSMGVLYHRPSPLEHLQQLKSLLKKDGQLILETLVIEGDEQTVLIPKDRYASMRNVWFIPSSKALITWLERIGFKNIKLIHEDFTSLNEQRTTEWMTFKSLKDFLNPKDKAKTIENLPAPKRAILTANI